MELRPLGRTGVQVSKLCLGTMMFGAWGNPDHDESIRIIHRALDAGIDFIDTADVYSAGESEEIVGKALKGRRDDVVLATKVWGPMGEDANQARRLAPLDHQRGRELAAAPGHRLDRPLPDPPPRPGHRHRGDARRAHRPRPAGQGPLRRLTRRSRRGRSSRRNGPRATATAALPQRAAALLAAHPRDRARRAAHRRAYGMGILTYSPLPAAGSRAATADSSPTSPARQRLANRFDMSLPENQRKLEAAEQLAKLAEEAGLTLIELALAFVVNHPAVTSAIIGPRTMEHLDSQLPAADVVLTPTLDRIDEIVRPASTSTPPTPATANRSSSPACGDARRNAMQITRSNSTPERRCRLVHRRRVRRHRRRRPPVPPRSPRRSCTSRPAREPPGTRIRTARRSSSPKGSASASARAAPSRSSVPGDRVFFEPRREPLARRHAQPLHGPHRYAAEQRVRQPRHLGQARQR